MNSRNTLDHDRFRIQPGTRVRLADFDPAATPGLKDKQEALKALEQDRAALAEAQERFYASGTYALLLIFQGMDASGKDGAIKHVMSGVNPQGCDVRSFKVPNPEELAHNFLWRHWKALPERGRIGIFNRSYYEDVLVVRVHPELLEHQRLPPGSDGKRLWRDRFDDINAFEQHLFRNGTRILKFFLHLSKAEQKQRFLDRLDTPEKNWKFSAVDVRERRFWDAYMEAFEDALSHTSTAEAPWFVVPADRKWFARALIADIVTSAIESLDLKYPELTPDQRRELEAARAELETEPD